tara:strand:- start:11229 stop:11966 length:738 start_codon:yes stop_codon:yes gene_type:complete
LTHYSIIAFIPARGGSKGVPRKNIKNLGGHPLIAYSIAACKMSKYIDDVYVSTEDLEIAKIAEKYGAKIPFIRPVEYAADDSTDHDVLNHFFKHVSAKELVFIRPTTPLRDPEYIDVIIERYFENKRKLTSVRSVHEMPESPYKFVKIENGFCKGFFKDYKGNKDYTNLPRQNFPKAYQPNGYADIVKRSIVESGVSFGGKVMAHITEFMTEVDVPYQFELLEREIEINGHKLLDYLNEKYKDQK